MEALDGINEVPSWGEVNACILGMNKNKAAGLSGLTPDFIALAGDIGPLQQAAEPESPFGETVFALVKAMFRHSIVPSCLNTALVVSIPKKGDKTQIDNYRGISLIEIVLKVAAGVVNRRVSEALEHNNRIVREQAGFRPNEECISQVVTLHETCTRRAALGLETYAAFIDFRKAFDTVCHEAVFAKLDHIGVRGRALGFVKALYKESGITVANAAGVRVRLERGVRQGCPLSPLLFNVFINDILDECRDLGVMVPGLPGGDNQIAGLLQADDLVLLAPSCEKLQQMLDKVTAWADRWQMSANGAKCGVMAFGDGAAAIAAAKSWSVQGETVPYVHTYRYLGVLVNDRLDVRAMVTDRAVHLEAACATLHSFLATTSIPMVARTKVLNAVAVAVAAYGGELWGMNQQMAQKLQSKLDETARWLLGASSRSRIASAMTVWKEIGTPPLHVRLTSARARALSKWGEAKTWIGWLIHHPLYGQEGNGTWVASTRKWLALRGPSVDDRAAAVLANQGHPLTLKAEMRLVRLVAQRQLEGLKRGESISRTVYESAGYGETAAGLRKLWTAAGEEAQTMNQILRMRSGFFWSGEKAARCRLIDQKYMDVCPVCGDDSGPETAEHYVLECSAWEGPRKTMFDMVGKGRLRAVSWHVLSRRTQLELLLGGEHGGTRLHNWSGIDLPPRPENAGLDEHMTAVVVCLTGFVRGSRVERNGRLWRSAHSRRPTGHGSSTSSKLSANTLTAAQ